MAIYLIVDLRLVDRRRQRALLIPHHIVLLIQMASLIRDRNHLARIRNLLRTDARRVARDPQQHGLGPDGGGVVSVALDLGLVLDVGEVARHEAAHGRVVGVEVRAQELGDDIGLLVGSGRQRLARGCGGGGDLFLGAGLAVWRLAVRCDAVLDLQKTPFFCFQALREVVEEGSEG